METVYQHDSAPAMLRPRPGWSKRPSPRTPAQLSAMFSRALAKSDEQARAGNLPQPVLSEPGFRRFAVFSRTTAGHPWLVDAVEDEPLTCDCERGAGWCWHRTHVERALAGEIGFAIMPRQPGWATPPPVSSSPARPIDRPPPGLTCPECGEPVEHLTSSGCCAACLFYGRPGRKDGGR